jgi:hypothetical protein
MATRVDYEKLSYDRYLDSLRGPDPCDLRPCAHCGAVEGSCARAGCIATTVRRLDRGAEHAFLCAEHYRETQAWHTRSKEA